MDLFKELTKTPLLLFSSSHAGSDGEFLKLLKKLKNEPVCYVTLNITFPAIKVYLEKEKISTKNFVFIDAISQSLKTTTAKQTDHCYFISSPGALTELSLT